LIEIELNTGEKGKARIPGKFRRKVYLNPNDIVLVGLESETVKSGFLCEIKYKYTPEQVGALYSRGLLRFNDGGVAKDIIFGDDKLNESDIEETESDLEEDDEDKTKDLKASREIKDRVITTKRNVARITKQTKDEDDINIDDI
jgi:translation initiation factor IF-1